MIHPSTMAGSNWFTTGLGATNPFQQSSSPFFRSTPFQGSGFGPGNNPFQSQQFGLQAAQIQNTINEVLRQSFPSILASVSGVATNSFQNPFQFSGPLGQQGPFGFQTPFNALGQIGFQTPFNTQGQIGSPNLLGLQGLSGMQSPFGFQTLAGQAQFGPQSATGSWDPNSLQNPNTFQELVRQTTNQTLQALNQQIPGVISQGIPGQSQNIIGQACQALAYACCYTVAACLTPLSQVLAQQNPQAQPNFLNYAAQVCQTVAYSCCTAAVTAVAQSNQAQSTPFNLNSAPQFTGTPGIPTGVGAF